MFIIFPMKIMHWNILNWIIQRCRICLQNVYCIIPLVNETLDFKNWRPTFVVQLRPSESSFWIPNTFTLILYSIRSENQVDPPEGPNAAFSIDFVVWCGVISVTEHVLACFDGLSTEFVWFFPSFREYFAIKNLTEKVGVFAPNCSRGTV